MTLLRPSRTHLQELSIILGLKAWVLESNDLGARANRLGRVRSPRLGRKPAHWTAVDQDYETLRIGMQALFADLGIITTSSAAA